MAMSLSLSPASDVLPAPNAQQGSVDTNNSSSILSVSNNISNSNATHFSNDPQIAPATGAKRKPSRRANTAERRATHNAVERQRRETLNGRFLDLAALLPNLSQIRRPSKSSIVNSSIAHIQASRRHRLVASRELKMLKHEADALRREVNEWRDRAALPRVDEPPRGDGFAMVITGELEVIQCVAIEEEDEDSEDGFGFGQPTGPMQAIPHPQQQVPSYNTAYLDEVEEEVAMLGAMYAQQQTAQLQHQAQIQHPIMSSPHDLEDRRMAAMLLNAQNGSQPVVPSAGYATNSRATPYTNGSANWVPSQVAGFTPAHLFTPPSSSHGFSGNNSASGSPVGGVSANGTNTNSPASTTSTLSSFSGGSPLSVVPSHQPQGFRRERSGSLTGTSPGSQSPAYELHQATHAAMQDFSGVPRMSCGSFVPSHQHMFGQGPGMHVQPQAVGVGGGASGLMMMMM
jgi:hypothetical protein